MTPQDRGGAWKGPETPCSHRLVPRLCPVAAGFQVSGLLSCSWLQLSQPMSSGVSGEEGSACLWKALTYFMVLPRVV